MNEDAVSRDARREPQSRRAGAVPLPPGVAEGLAHWARIALPRGGAAPPPLPPDPAAFDRMEPAVPAWRPPLAASVTPRQQVMTHPCLPRRAQGPEPWAVPGHQFRAVPASVPAGPPARRRMGR